MASRGTHLYSIGHSNHPLDRFLELLKQQEIQALADIRRFPGSRKHPHFGKASLEEVLRDSGLEYRWIEALGGRRHTKKDIPSPNLGLRNSSFRSYADYMLSAEFRAGIDELLSLTSIGNTAMMCAEGLWWQCHRRLVSDWLVANNLPVAHILPDGQLKPHEPTAEARVQDGGVIYPALKSLFPDEGR